MSEATKPPLFVSNQVGNDPYSVPLDKIDVADFELFETDELWGWFKRLREEDPVHYCVSQDEEVGGVATLMYAFPCHSATLVRTCARHTKDTTLSSSSPA